MPSTFVVTPIKDDFSCPPWIDSANWPWFFLEHDLKFLHFPISQELHFHWSYLACPNELSLQDKRESQYVYWEICVYSRALDAIAQISSEKLHLPTLAKSNLMAMICLWQMTRRQPANMEPQCHMALFVCFSLPLFFLFFLFPLFFFCLTTCLSLQLRLELLPKIQKHFCYNVLVKML